MSYLEYRKKVYEDLLKEIDKGTNVNQQLIEEGHATAYFGGKR